MKFPEYDALDATGLAALIANKQVSPTEAFEAALERVALRNPALNAVVHRFDDQARARILAGLPEGPLSGVPFLLKDIGSFYAGQPSTASTSLLANWKSPFDSELVRRCKAAGLVIFGRTNTPELGLLNITEPRFRGPTRNPWNLERSPGGSSGGSAAAVAARMVPMAHGNDGGGSIRIPASACGLFGLGPTRARVSHAPAYGDPWNGLVQDHVLTRSVRDSAAMLDILAGNVPGDPYWAPPQARPYSEEIKTPPGNLRIAFSTDSLMGRHTHPECVEAVRGATKLLENLGHRVAEARPFFSREEMVNAYLVIVAANVRSILDDIGNLIGRPVRPKDVEPATWGLAQLGRVAPSDALVSALNAVRRISRGVAQFFSEFDVFVTPTLAYPPVRIGELALKPRDVLGLKFLAHFPVRKLLKVLRDQVAQEAFEHTPNTAVFNMTGQPAMSVPLHWSTEGLPIGIQFAGRFGDEATLFRLAAQLENAQPWANRLPSALTWN